MDFFPCLICEGSVAPELAAETEYRNLLWFDTGSGSLRRYDGATWVEKAAPSGGGGGGGPHTHPTSDIIGLDTALTDLGAEIDNKADLTHTHAQSEISGLVTALADKADSVHGHTISDTTGLQTALDGKAAASHTHAQADVTNLVTDLAAKQVVSEKAQPNGYASLGGDGKVPSAQLPAGGGGGSGTPVDYVALLAGI